MVLKDLALVGAGFVDRELGMAVTRMRGRSTPHAQWTTAFLVGLDGDVVVESMHGTERGPVVVVPPNCLHVTSGRGERLDLVLDADAHRATTHALLGRAPFATRLPAAKSAVDRVAKATGARDVLEDLLRSVPGTLVPTGSAHLADARIERLIVAPDPPRSLAAWSAHVGLSASHFSRLFHRVVGLPLQRWLAWRRLLRALGELDHGSLAAAAAGAGFADQAHFTRTCRALLGHTPTTLRPGLRAAPWTGQASLRPGAPHS